MFSPNLLESSQSSERENRIRNRLVLCGGFLAIGIILVIKALPPQVTAPIQSHLLVSVRANDLVAGKVGGDAVPEPVHIPAPKLPQLTGELPLPERFTASSIVVKDQGTGALLYGKDEYHERPIASITKLMSALVILERRPDWNATATVVSDAIQDTHMYAGDTYTLRELWNTALIGSSNKAILTLADAVGWPRTAFVERMNQKALEFGMASTRFTEPTGLDEGNISNASDIALLLSEAMNAPDIKNAVVQKEFTLYAKERKKEHHMWNTDWLLLGWIPHAFGEFYGGKTGFITASGYNFAMQAGDGKGRLLDVVVLGAESHEARFTEARDVAEWALANYKWPTTTTAP